MINQDEHHETHRHTHAHTHTHRPLRYHIVSLANCPLVLPCSTSVFFPPDHSDTHAHTLTHTRTQPPTPLLAQLAWCSTPPSLSLSLSLSLLPRVLVGGGLHGSPAPTLHRPSLGPLNSSTQPPWAPPEAASRRLRSDALTR